MDMIRSYKLTQYKARSVCSDHIYAEGCVFNHCITKEIEVKILELPSSSLEHDELLLAFPNSPPET